MKKQLNAETIKNELEGSVFFPRAPQAPVTPLPQNTVTEQATSQPANQQARLQANLQTSKDASRQTGVSQTQPLSEPNSITVPASKQESMLASSHASTLADDTILPTIAKTLRSLGKEVIYVRSTLEEKTQIKDIVYTYARQGIKTSDNEIGRIAINYLLKDYEFNGAESVLAKVLKDLHT